MWNASISLRSKHVLLRPLQIADADALVAAARDGALWNLAVTVVPDAGSIDDYVKHALHSQTSGTAQPFTILLNDPPTVIGSTRYWNMDADNRSLEIGHTWIGESWQRSFVNTECKYLLLRYAFETLECIRVQFTTDELNARSRAAILRLGAVEEGVIRHERIMPNGRKRNSLRYSIIDSEWPQVRGNLECKLRTMNSVVEYFAGEYFAGVDANSGSA